MLDTGAVGESSLGVDIKASLRKASQASLQTRLLQQWHSWDRSPSTSSRTSLQSGYQRRSPQAISLWFLLSHQASVNSELQSKWHLRIWLLVNAVRTARLSWAHAFQNSQQPGEALTGQTKVSASPSPQTLNTVHTLHFSHAEAAIAILPSLTTVHSYWLSTCQSTFLSEVTENTQMGNLLWRGQVLPAWVASSWISRQAAHPAVFQSHDAQGGLAELGGTISLLLPHLDPKQPTHPLAQMTHL